ncbi:hypothetical protein GCM10008949_11780 [Deinococcus humi]|nr:hypothetical protein GCM10008949_11780 [Deinococcus humi]
MFWAGAAVFCAAVGSVGSLGTVVAEFKVFWMPTDVTVSTMVWAELTPASPSNSPVSAARLERLERVVCFT